MNLNGHKEIFRQCINGCFVVGHVRLIHCGKSYCPEHDLYEVHSLSDVSGRLYNVRNLVNEGKRMGLIRQALKEEQ